jgi:DNA invertase Pin-like site-specific DNA recombinase
MLGAFAEFERTLIRERQKEGIALAKAAGAYSGRKQALTDEQAKELVALDAANHGKSRKALADKFGISRTSLYRYLENA